jgi:hypothetical protein
VEAMCDLQMLNSPV